MVVAALVAQAGTALVQAMVTDGWEGVRHKVAKLSGRGQPEAELAALVEEIRESLTVAASGHSVAAGRDVVVGLREGAWRPG